MCAHVCAYSKSFASKGSPRPALRSIGSLEVDLAATGGFHRRPGRAVVGGVLTGVGGFLGIRYVQGRSDKEAEQRFRGALLIVLDELGVNEINIENLIGQTFGPAEFYDQTYRSVELILATRLRTVDRQLLAATYAPLRARWTNEDPGATLPIGSYCAK